MYEMKKPISWQKFKSYPRDVQKEYLQWFADEFGAGNMAMGNVFGVSSAYVGVSLRKMGLGEILHYRQKEEEKIKFALWMKEQNSDSEIEEAPVPVPEEPKKEKLVMTPFFNTISSGEILLEGKASEIGQTLFNMFQNEIVTMQIKFEVNKEKMKGAKVE